MYHNVKDRRAESRATSSLDCYAEARKLFSVSKRAPFSLNCDTKLQKYRMSCICHVTHGTRWDEKVTIWDEMGRKWDEMGRKWDGKVAIWDEKKETASYRLLLYIL